jgi:hypothetical protein
MFRKRCEYKERHANKKFNVVHKDMQAKNPTLCNHENIENP